MKHLNPTPRYWSLSFDKTSLAASILQYVLMLLYIVLDWQDIRPNTAHFVLWYYTVHFDLIFGHIKFCRWYFALPSRNNNRQMQFAFSHGKLLFALFYIFQALSFNTTHIILLEWLIFNCLLY